MTSLNQAIPTAAITKSQGISHGLDELLDSYEAGRLDETRRIKLGDKPNWLAELLEKYEDVLENEKYNMKPYDKKIYSDVFNAIKSDISDVLEPQQINDFLQATLPYENHPEYSYLTGLFISVLIQKSYDAGHNSFKLNTKNIKTISHLGAFIKGKKRKPLKIEIMGNGGNNCSEFADYSSFVVKGNIGHHCGYHASHCKFIVEGSAKHSCGYYAAYSSFIVKGNAEDSYGRDAHCSRFVAEGNVGDNFGRYSHNCTFIRYGSVGDYCGWGAVNPDFRLLKKKINKSG